MTHTMYIACTIMIPFITGKDQATKWYVNWRLFFIACAEFFGIAKGEEYVVSHYRFVKP